MLAVLVMLPLYSKAQQRRISTLHNSVQHYQVAQSALHKGSKVFNVIGSLMLAGMLAKEPRCVKWTWYGDVYNRTVICLEWTKPPPPKDKDPKKT
jgi:hypothetical protein